MPDDSTSKPAAASRASVPTLPPRGSARFQIVVALADKTEVIALDGARSWSIGRSLESNLRIDDPAVSRRHALLHASGDELEVEELGSSNGTLLVANQGGAGGAGRERRLAPGQRSRLRVGDALRIGPALLSLQGSGDTSRERTAAPRRRETVLVDPAMRALFELVGRAARRDMAVLILGETGVGKELIAETVHEGSPRAHRRFLALNCAALPENLIESELFGHERGAFTGAHTARAGLLEESDGGTIFLDEIGELPLGTQAKLLRVLEDGSVMRLGGKRGRRIDVRFVAATNRDLASEVQRGGFRSDVYHRISGLVVRVPPLRERPSEIEPLARHFLLQLCADQREAAPELTPAALAALAQHSWPGNVRELRNVIERAALLADGGPIGAEQIVVDRPRQLPALDGDAEEPTRVDASPHRSAPHPVADERARLIEALETCGGNQRRAAELLGVSRRTLVNRLDKWDLPRPRKTGWKRGQ